MVFGAAALGGLLADDKSLGANNGTSVRRDESGGRINVQRDRAGKARRTIWLRDAATLETVSLPEADPLAHDAAFFRNVERRGFHGGLLEGLCDYWR